MWFPWSSKRLGVGRRKRTLGQNGAKGERKEEGELSSLIVHTFIVSILLIFFLCFAICLCLPSGQETQPSLLFLGASSPVTIVGFLIFFKPSLSRCSMLTASTNSWKEILQKVLSRASISFLLQKMFRQRMVLPLRSSGDNSGSLLDGK